MNIAMTDTNADWRSRIGRNLARADTERVRDLFTEINPHLVGDRRFEERWTERRRDAAVLIAVLERGLDGASAPSVLLTVRSLDMPSHAGQVSFPGGRPSAADAGPEDTALREAEEETGLARERVQVVGRLGVHHGGLGFQVTPVVGLVAEAGTLNPCPREVAEIFEAPLEFVTDLRNFRIEKRSHDGVDFNAHAAPYGDWHIWGLTAAILRTFAETFQDEPALAV